MQLNVFYLPEDDMLRIEKILLPFFLKRASSYKT